MKRHLCALGVGFSLLTPTAYSAISLEYGTLYTQNFDSLASSGSSATLPAGWEIAEAGSGANGLYTAANGSIAVADLYSFGATASGERALGSIADESFSAVFGAQFENNTGLNINRIGITYRGENWRLGTTGRKDKLDFQYSLDATSLTSGTWTDANQLDFRTPTTSGAVGARDGNSPLNSARVGAQIAFLDIPEGASFWIRWSDFNATGNDDGLSIDEFTITAVPEASGVWVALATLGFAGFSFGRQQLRRRTTVAE